MFIITCLICGCQVDAHNAVMSDCPHYHLPSRKKYWDTIGFVEVDELPDKCCKQEITGFYEEDGCDITECEICGMKYKTKKQTEV